MFLFPVYSLCTDPPGSPQEKQENGPLLRFFLRGGGVCTQASQSISLVLKAERRISEISEAEVRSFPNLLLYQLTKYSNLFLVLYYPEYQTPVISLLGKPRLKTTPKSDHLNRRRMLQSFLLYKILGLSLLQKHKFFNFINDSTNNTLNNIQSYTML